MTERQQFEDTFKFTVGSLLITKSLNLYKIQSTYWDICIPSKITIGPSLAFKLWKIRDKQ